MAWLDLNPVPLELTVLARQLSHQDAKFTFDIFPFLIFRRKTTEEPRNMHVLMPVALGMDPLWLQTKEEKIVGWLGVNSGPVDYYANTLPTELTSHMANLWHVLM